MEQLNIKPASVLDLIPETVYPTPDISQPIIPTPKTFAQAFSAARRAGVKVFDYKGKKYGTQLKGETETVGKGTGAGATTEKGYVSESNKTVNNNTQVATVNIPGAKVVAKRDVDKNLKGRSVYLALTSNGSNIGGKEYSFSSEEEKNAFVERVNRSINNMSTRNKYRKQLKGETETADKGVTTTVKTKQGNTSVSNKPVDDNTPVATVNLPEVEVVAKKYSMVNNGAVFGGKQYWFPTREERDAFVKRVNRAINYSLIEKRFQHSLKNNWYRTKIG